MGVGRFYKMISALRRRFSEDEPKERRRLVESHNTNASGGARAHGESDAEEGNGAANTNGYGTHDG